MNKPTVEELRSRLSYNPDNGSLTWIAARRKNVIGTVSKSLDVAGYVQVNFGAWGVLKGHRIAWAMHYGKWPDGPIDHINGIRSDNRIANLREVDHKVNCQNIRLGSVVNHSTGFLGVWRDKRKPEGPKSYRAKIMSGGKQYHLGGYPTPEEAHAAYVEAKRKLHAGCTI